MLTYEDTQVQITELILMVAGAVGAYVREGDTSVAPAIRRCKEAFTLSTMDTEFIKDPLAVDVVLGLTELVGFVGAGMLEAEQEHGFEALFDEEV